MKAAKLIILTFASMMLINCGGGGSADKAINTNGQSQRGIPVVDAKSAEEAERLNPTGILKGRIFKDDRFNNNQDSQDNFQAHINSFLSPQFLQSEIGTVNGIEQTADTGVEFWGRGFQYKNGQTFDLSQQLVSGRDVLDLETAELRINIFQKLSNGQTQEVPIHFNRLNGVQSNQAGQLVDSVVQVGTDGNVLIQLIFADSLGKLSLTGYLMNGSNYPDGQARYEGQVTFRNLERRTENGPVDATHTEEVLGRFVVQACGFFQCSQ